MTHANLLAILISILLMTNYRLMAQEELTETSTESVTESQTPTTTPASPSESDSFYTTCDFDLENIESLLPYLPDICTDIYYNRTDNDLYALYLEESQNFAKFYKKLNDYELRDEPNGDKEDLIKYPFEAKLRNDIYSKVDWLQCITIANSSTADYLNCLKGKRLELAKLIPVVEEK